MTLSSALKLSLLMLIVGVPLGTSPFLFPLEPAPFPPTVVVVVFSLSLCFPLLLSWLSIGFDAVRCRGFSAAFHVDNSVIGIVLALASGILGWPLGIIGRCLGVRCGSRARLGALLQA